jgi:uncharacterized protein involved in exopolysaccharide biosynthesis
MENRNNFKDEGDYPYAGEDEINLLDLLMVLVRHKMLIIGVVFFSGVAAVVISLLMTNIYRSEAIIVPRTQENGPFRSMSALEGLGGIVAEGLVGGGGGPLEKLEVILKSRNLTNRVIKEHKLMPIMFSHLWDKKKKKWHTDDPPTIQDAWKVMLEDMLSIRVDAKKGTVKVGIDHEDPETAKKFVDSYIRELSETLREEVLRDAAQNARFFREQLERTSDILLKEKIYSMLANEIEKETFAQAQEYYSFLVVDPPIVPDPDKEIKPKRALICILSVFVAFFLAVFLAFLKEYVHRLRTEDQERYQKMVQGLKFRNNK